MEKYELESVEVPIFQNLFFGQRQCYVLPRAQQVVSQLTQLDTL